MHDHLVRERAGISCYSDAPLCRKPSEFHVPVPKRFGELINLSSRLYSLTVRYELCIGELMARYFRITAALAFAFAAGIATMYATNGLGNSSVEVEVPGEVIATAGQAADGPASRSVVRDGELENVLMAAGFDAAFAFKFSGDLLFATLYP